MVKKVTPMRVLILFLLIILVIVIFLFTTPEFRRGGDLLICTVVIILLTTFYLRYKLRTSKELMKWSLAHKFLFYEFEKGSEITKRFQLNPGKKYLFSRIHNEFSGPYVEGKIANRNVWIYPITGKFYQLRWRVISYFFSGGVEITFDGWCMEISTNKIPVIVRLLKKYLGNIGEERIENIELNKTYNIYSKYKKLADELFDPALVKLVSSSNIAAIEFSDSSVVFINTTFPPKYRYLENMLQYGIKIAEQVDRNFPLGKY